MLIAPTEPPKLREIGRSSSVPENYGVDIYFPRKKVGVQRKEMDDFINSVHDGRLQTGVAKMKRLDISVLLLEGKPRWTLDGHLMGRHGDAQSWTLTQNRGMLWSVRQRGIWVDFTNDLNDTIVWLQVFDRWLSKEKHRALDQRPGPKSVWGTPTDHDWACHLVMGLPGVGPELADRIVKTMGVPFTWKVTEEELMGIEGLGPKKVKKLVAALG